MIRYRITVMVARRMRVILAIHGLWFSVDLK